jgi:hypothetical protein
MLSSKTWANAPTKCKQEQSADVTVKTLKTKCKMEMEILIAENEVSTCSNIIETLFENNY